MGLYVSNIHSKLKTKRCRKGAVVGTNHQCQQRFGLVGQKSASIVNSLVAAHNAAALSIALQFEIVAPVPSVTIASQVAE